MVVKELELKYGERLLGTLRAHGQDFPWTNCEFEPKELFQSVRILFAEELKLLNADDMEAWESAYGRIAAIGLGLVDVQCGDEISQFILHIEGNEAWFRC